MKALIVVDLQNDFLPGGALAVPAGDQIVPVANRLMRSFPLVVATQDWHPPGHASFASAHGGREPFETIVLNGLDQTLWPNHCEWSTAGAAFSKELDLGPVAAIFRKGMDPAVDSYSGFFDNGRRHQTGLAGYLRGLEVNEILVVGLAGEICVAFTAADGASLGFETTVIEDAIRPLDPQKYASKRQELQEQGVKFITADAAMAA